MDFIDKTLDREQAITDAALANRPRYLGVSAFECQECGDEIPKERRIALPGVTSCVYCAEIQERSAKNA